MIANLVRAEALKLRRSPALRLVWLAPLLFVGLDLLGDVLVLRHASAGTMRGIHPLMNLTGAWLVLGMTLVLALLPAHLMRYEHRNGAWKHLHAQPVPREALFLVKLGLGMVLVAVQLALVGLLIRLQWAFLLSQWPALAMTFPTGTMIKVLGWMFLGSFPALALNLWIADRLPHAAVPILSAFMGLIILSSLPGNVPTWKWDLLPWTLPNAAVERVYPRRGTPVHLGTPLVVLASLGSLMLFGLGGALDGRRGR